jgi:uncharacterized membrane protein
MVGISEVRSRPFAALCFAMLIVLAGCAKSPLSTWQADTAAGVLAGALTGAIIGAAVAQPLIGSIVGAGIGAIGGAIIGDNLQQLEIRNQEAQRQVHRQESELERQQRRIERLKVYH